MILTIKMLFIMWKELLSNLDMLRGISGHKKDTEVHNFTKYEKAVGTKVKDNYIKYQKLFRIG